MNWRTASTEFGKQLLNVGVAGLIFVLIQPFAHRELTVEKAFWAVVWYVLFTGAGVLLIAFGSKDGK